MATASADRRFDRGRVGEARRPDVRDLGLARRRRSSLALSTNSSFESRAPRVVVAGTRCRPRPPARTPRAARRGRSGLVSPRVQSFEAAGRRRSGWPRRRPAVIWPSSADDLAGVVVGGRRRAAAARARCDRASWSSSCVDGVLLDLRRHEVVDVREELLVDVDDVGELLGLLGPGASGSMPDSTVWRSAAAFEHSVVRLHGELRFDDTPASSSVAPPSLVAGAGGRKAPSGHESTAGLSTHCASSAPGSRLGARCVGRQAAVTSGSCSPTTPAYDEAIGLDWYAVDPNLRLLLDRLLPDADDRAFAEDHVARYGALCGGPLAERAEITDKHGPDARPLRPVGRRGRRGRAPPHVDREQGRPRARRLRRPAGARRAARCRRWSPRRSPTSCARPRPRSTAGSA